MRAAPVVFVRVGKLPFLGRRLATRTRVAHRGSMTVTKLPGAAQLDQTRSSSLPFGLARNQHSRPAPERPRARSEFSRALRSVYEVVCGEALGLAARRLTHDAPGARAQNPVARAGEPVVRAFERLLLGGVSEHTVLRRR